VEEIDQGLEPSIRISKPELLLSVSSIPYLVVLCYAVNQTQGKVQVPVAALHMQNLL
jgi:hypothetical protein